MAEALISLLIEHLGSMAIDGIEEQIKLVKGVKDDVKKLKSNLVLIQAVLQDAEQKQLGNEAVKIWLQELKNASEEMENVLDEWSTTVLEDKIKKEEDEALENSSSSNKVCFPVSLSSSCSFTKVGRLSMRRDIARKIKKLNRELTRISQDRNNYGLNTSTVVERPRPPKTTFHVDVTKVHGRDEEKSLLVRKLLCESSANDDGRSSLHIIPIVGLGGLGKTTLAQLAYDNEAVKTHFEKRAWVCVSDPFDEIKVSKAIVEGLGSSTQSSELNAVVEVIYKSLEGKRVLIVLDDVWLEDCRRWEILGAALRNGGKGSRVLVTTRKQEVAIMMGVAKDHIICLKKLSEEHCWSIFSQLAFMGRRAEERQQLEPIGRQIAAKSRGLPLVAKTLGSLMPFKKTASQWEDILGSELWESNNEKVRDVFAPFLLSYYDLPPLEKRCFLYCSVFPQDYDIRRDDLIEMWMSQGYFGGREDSWNLGRDCFETLAMRSFFQEITENEDHGGVRCKMHDIVHDFAHFLSGDEYVFMEIDNDELKNALRNFRNKQENTHHLTLKGRFPISLGNLKNLRTLFFLYSGIRSYGESLIFSQLTCLRTLSLSCCGLERLSEDIGLLKHLRYLDLTLNAKLIELPKKLFDLCNLETLNLMWCSELKTLPECISKLVSLKHLYIDACWRLEGLPKGLGKISGLRTLDRIVLGPKEKGTYLDIGDLNKLKHLQFQGVLRITGLANEGTTVDDVAMMNLNAKPQVLTLNLEFRTSSVCVDSNNHNDAEILSSINPHPNLKYLRIMNYLGLTLSPAWMMSLSNLTHLVLVGFANYETFPPLGKLPSLEILQLYRFSKICTVGEEFLGITESDREVISFPKLEELAFSDHSQWRVWEEYCTKTAKIMPCLRKLRIDDCGSLETLPEFLKMTPLQELSIRYSDTLKKQCQKEVGKEWHKISHVPNIEFNWKHVQKDGVWIQTDETESSG